MGKKDIESRKNGPIQNINQKNHDQIKQKKEKAFKQSEIRNKGKASNENLGGSLADHKDKPKLK